MTSNVIAFQKPVAEAPRSEPREVGAKTLFMHVKSTTLIVHLAAPRCDERKFESRRS